MWKYSLCQHSGFEKNKNTLLSGTDSSMFTMVKIIAIEGNLDGIHG